MILSAKKNWVGFFGKILISYMIFILLVYFLNQNNFDRFSSFLIVLFSATVSLFYLGLGSYSKFGFNVTGYFIFALIFKIFIGFLFWEFYLFPDYFTNSSSQFQFNHVEYLITFDRLQEIAEYRISNGLFSIPSYGFADKYILIRYIMSGIFLSGSFNAFDLAVQNSLFSIFTSLVIAQIVKEEGGTSKQIKIALLLTIFQPISFISTMIWRDVVGQFFLALGGYFLYKSTKKNKILMVALILLATISFFINRFLYAFFPLIVIFGYFFFLKKNKFGLLMLPFVYFFIDYFDNILSVTNHLTENYGDNIMSVNFWFFLPINVVRLFLGPFPWTNWFTINDNTIFLIGGYFQAVMNISLIIFLIKVIYRKKYLLKLKSIFSVLSSVDILLLLLFPLFIMAGLGTKEVHIFYMSTGIIFLVPTISLAYYNQSFKTIFLKVFLFYIIINTFFIALGFSDQGFGSSFR